MIKSTKYHHFFKILITGDACSGKYNLIRRFVYNEFHLKYTGNHKFQGYDGSLRTIQIDSMTDYEKEIQLLIFARKYINDDFYKYLRGVNIVVL